MIKKMFRIRFIRFLFVGGLNTLFGYSLFSLCIFLGLHYAIAVLIATTIGVLFNFKTIGKIVFKNHNNQLIFKFFVVYSVVYVVNVLGLKIFNIFDISNYIGGAILIMPIAILSYFLNKNFVFEKNNNESILSDNDIVMEGVE
ncbi:GtrA family protein [bacterium]